MPKGMYDSSRIISELESWIYLFMCFFLFIVNYWPISVLFINRWLSLKWLYEEVLFPVYFTVRKLHSWSCTITPTPFSNVHGVPTAWTWWLSLQHSIKRVLFQADISPCCFVRTMSCRLDYANSSHCFALSALWMFALVPMHSATQQKALSGWMPSASRRCWCTFKTSSVPFMLWWPNLRPNLSQNLSHP